MNKISILVIVVFALIFLSDFSFLEGSEKRIFRIGLLVLAGILALVAAYLASPLKGES